MESSSDPTGSGVDDYLIRRATPADAADLVDLGRAVSSEPEGWLITADDWRNVGEERRYLPGTARPRPGLRLTSMMAPSIVLGEGRPRLVVGSAGSVRLRGAIVQIVVNVAKHGMDVGSAIRHPRVHLEEPHVHCEGGWDPAELDRLQSWGYELVRWRRRNLFFGGAAGVERRDDGTLAAAGDPRRGGAGLVVAA